MNSRDLIETARRLADSAVVLPTQTDLRRAVSAAYYALFHCLARTAADLLTGSSTDSPEWHQVYRALEHGKARLLASNKTSCGRFQPKFAPLATRSSTCRKRVSRQTMRMKASIPSWML